MGDFTITKSGVLKSYQGNNSSVVIPDGVKKIGSMALYCNSDVISVIIPGCVTEIGESAFGDCAELESVKILGGKPLTICDGAFGDCKKLAMLELPNSIKRISDNAFRGCDGLADEAGNIIVLDTLYSHAGKSSDVTIKEGVQFIAPEAFKWCEDVEKVHIPEGVKTIGAYAFCGCSNLKTINIPDSVTEIGEFAFKNSPGLADDNGFLVIRNSIFSYSGKKEEPVIPASVERIEPWAFEGSQSCVRITISDSVTEIGKNAFYQCSRLSYVSLPNGLKEIAGSLFSWCAALSAVRIPETVTTIGSLAFYGCASLTEITIPESVVSIGANAFQSCENLAHIILPQHLTELGDGAFKPCKNLKAVYFPKSVNSIGPNTFSGCYALERIEAPEHLRKDFDRCYLSISIDYYSDEQLPVKRDTEDYAEIEDAEEVNRVVIKCRPEDFDTVRMIFEEALARFYMEGSCLDDTLFEKVLAEIRENDDLCSIQTTDDSVCATIADGIEAGGLLAWKLLGKNSFRNEFGSIAGVGESILKNFPHADFSVTHLMQDISETVEKVWTEDGKIVSEWME